MEPIYWHVRAVISFITSSLQSHRVLTLGRRSDDRTAFAQTRLTLAPDVHDSDHLSGSRILELTFVILGFGLMLLSIVLPILMETAVQHRGAITAGYLRYLTPLIVDAAMASSFVAIVVILSFERSWASRKSVLFGIVTLSVFVTEIVLSLYLSLVRSPVGAASIVFGIYTLIGLVPLGLACTMFTLASLLRAGA